MGERGSKDDEVFTHMWKEKARGKEVKKIEKDEDEETLRKLVPKKFWK